MDKTILVAPDFKIGDQVLELLDAAKFPVTAAAWVLSEELGGWQFVVGTPFYDKLGGLEAYGRLIAAVRAHDPHSMLFDDVRLMGNRNPFVHELRRSFEHLGFRKGMKTAGPIGNLYVDDAVVYRIK
ncbi:MAG: hypothetical protein ABSF22_20750 [Bryobacteraceae bacterium]|jgi:hypothetical protein